MPNGAFNICCPRDYVSRHNGDTSGAPLKPLRDDSVPRYHTNVQREGSGSRGGGENALQLAPGHAIGQCSGGHVDGDGLGRAPCLGRWDGDLHRHQVHLQEHQNQKFKKILEEKENTRYIKVAISSNMNWTGTRFNVKKKFIIEKEKNTFK